MGKKNKQNKTINKFYNFHEYNESTNSTDFYVYGAIVGGGSDWKWDDADVCFEDMRNALADCPDGSTLNMYINSPGGDVITTQGIKAMLERAKDRNVTINAYIDGLAASCASWLAFVADNVYIYQQSLYMIHKPSCGCWGNADDMQKEIEILDKIENDVIIPLYMKNAKDGIVEEDFRNYMKNETWFTSSELLEVFDNITLLEDKKKISCCVDKDVFKNYKHVPDNIKEMLERMDESMSKISDLFTDDDIKDEVKDEEVEDTEIENEESKDEKVEEEKDEESKDEEVEDEKEEKVEEEAKEEEAKEESSEEVEDACKKKKCGNESSEEVENYLQQIKELQDTIKAMQPFMDEYKKEKESKALNELTKAYKDKFSRFGLEDKFESEEVQDLIKKGLSNKESLIKLDNMIFDSINLNEKVIPSKNYVKESPANCDDLLGNTSASSFGFVD